MVPVIISIVGLLGLAALAAGVGLGWRDRRRGRKGMAMTWLAVAIGVPVLVLLAGWWYMIKLPGRSHRGPLPPMTNQQREIEANLRSHVQTLAGDIGGRSTYRPKKLEQAADWVERQLRGMGYPVELQRFECDSDDGRVDVRNIIAELPGGARAGEIVIVGGHYDSVLDCPAANDNGSGVAAMLEIARLMRGQRPSRTVRFVAWVNEEPPYFKSEQMGSRVHARRCKERGENIVAAVSLETIGYYTDEPDSQHYPAGFGTLYPSTGNFIAVVGNLHSATLTRRFVGTFRREADFPCHGGAVPGWIPSIDLSDHWSYWQEGYPAIMVTDTAMFRYPHYHEDSDTPDKLDYPRFARVTDGLVAAVAELAGP